MDARLAQQQSGSGRLTDKVVNGLLALISEQGLAPGAKLPTTQVLCGQFGVSRTVVREAVASLQAEGYVVSRRGSGVYVRDVVAQPARSFIMESPQDIADVMEIMELRMSVEIEAAALAALRRTEADLLRIEQAMASFARNLDSNTLASEADRALHVAIAQATGNLKFKHFVDEIGERLIPRKALGAAFAKPEDQQAFLQRIHSEHRAIVQAITDRDPEQARTFMRTHLENGRKRYRTWNAANTA